ncbi:MAG: hypothetical protein M1822_006146 [Bathelium mastoideum]|nr:MAG: hypothetical protein M1822_006146 [Bathelium mastoideum]
MSPRRSSRPRNTQPPPSAPSHSNSTSSVSSARGERSTRSNNTSNNKAASPPKSSTPQLLSSSEEVDDPAHAPSDAPPTRRSKRGQTTDAEHTHPTKIEDELDDDIEEEEDEEEVTRCVCGHQEYPGPPVEVGKNHHSAASSANSDVQNDEAGSLFIQCDICKVWQHGGCVGIMDEAMSPDEYFCEECRKDFHKLMTGQRGQKYSRYLPVLEPPPAKPTRKSSFPKDSERTSRNSDRKKGNENSFTKRRSTMNSRGAYDDAEVIRMVIEVSKGENATQSSNSSNRKGKRNRDDSSDDVKLERKRQRTGSETPELVSHTNTASLTAESDEEQMSAKAIASKKAKGTVPKNQRDKEIKEKEKERERERAEQTSKRNARAGRRRGDASESPDTAPTNAKPTDDTKSIKPDTTHSPDTPPLNPPISSTTATTTTAPSRKIAGRPSKRGGRLSRPARDASSAIGTDPHDSPRHLHRGPDQESSLTNGHSSSGDGIGSAIVTGIGSGGGRSKARIPHHNPHKTGWTELRRRAAGMMEIIARIQVELAGEAVRTSATTRPPSAASGAAKVVKGQENEEEGKGEDTGAGTGAAADKEGQAADVEKEGGGIAAEENKIAGMVEGVVGMLGREFRELTSAEMMDVLTRNLMAWQKKYGKESERA